MSKTFNTIFSYICVFMIGAYAASEYKFNTPVDDYRWGMALFFFGFSLLGTFNTKEK